MQRHIIFVAYGTLCFVFFLLACGKSHKPSVEKLFALMPGQQIGISFQNLLPDQAPNGLNIIQYLYYYNGGGVAATDLNGDSLPDLYFTSNLGTDALYINRGGFQFDSIPLPYPLNPGSKWTTGVTYADVNQDGRTDLYVCQVGNYKGAKGRNLLYINEGNNEQGLPRFSEQAEKFGLGLSAFCTQAAFFDFDRDGDLDCFVLCHSVHSAGVYRDTSQTRQFDPLSADRLYRNDNGYFTDISQSAGIYGGIAGYGLGLTISDLNNDGWQDIYVGNDFHESDYLYLNRQGKSFKEIGSAAFGHTSNFTMGTDAADLNQDGRMDLLSLDMLPPDEYTRKASQPVDQLDIFEYKHQLGYHYQYPRNALQINLGTDESGIPIFAETGQYSGVDATDWSWSPLLADFDLDGQTDIFITNGIRRRGNNLDFLKYNSQSEVQTSATDAEIANHMPEGKVPNAAFRNLGGLKFEPTAHAWGLDLNGYSNGAAYADLDVDGDLDLIVNNLNASASIYQNMSSGGKRLTIKLKGRKENQLGIGARVRVNEKHFSREYEVMPTRGFQSASDAVLHIALNIHGEAPWIGVQWPDGSFSEGNIQVDSGEHKTIIIDQAVRSKRKDWLWPFQAATQLSGAKATIKHLPKAEFAKQGVSEKLVPWQSLARGGKVKPSASQPNLICTVGAQPQVFNATTNRIEQVITMGEIMSAAFADLDDDKVEELIACLRLPSGICMVEFFKQQGGKWQAAAPILVQCDPIAVIATADVDGDSDIDLFLGAGYDYEGYGLAPESFLLINEGKAKFQKVSMAGENRFGLIRDAAWADMDGDSRLDLVLAGEWMPITILFNQASGWDMKELQGSSGLWQTVIVLDINGDGKKDLIGGNFGENNRLRADLLNPAWLLVADFDNNRQTEAILGYYHLGEPYVLIDRDLLANQLPSIKKKYPQYDAYARASFDDVFPPSANAGTSLQLKAEIIASAAFINPGMQGTSWKIEKLPAEVQWSTVKALLDIDEKQILAAGNLFHVQPYLGRQDAGVIWDISRSSEGVWNARPYRLIREEILDMYRDHSNVIWLRN